MKKVMINFCKNTLHTLLGTNSKKSETRNGSDRSEPVCTGGLCLLAAGDCLKPANVVDSASVKTGSGPKRNDGGETGGGSGFLDEIGGGGGGGGDGLSSCTESLGFESSDQVEKMNSSLVDDEEKRLMMMRSTVGLRWRKESRDKSRWRERVKNLPPPLSSLNSNGQSNFYLKSVRENGRLVLTEMSVERPEVFLAEREDGRLRLHLIQSDDDDDEDVPDSNPEEDVEVEGEVEVPPIVDEVSEEEVEVDEDIEVEEEEEEEEVHVEWMMPLRSGGCGGGEGFRRCHELSSHRHRNHYNHHRHTLQCVMTR